MMCSKMCTKTEKSGTMLFQSFRRDKSYLNAYLAGINLKRQIISNNDKSVCDD